MCLLNQRIPRNDQPLGFGGSFADGHQVLIAIDALHEKLRAIGIAGVSLIRVQAHLLGHLFGKHLAASLER